MHKPHEYTVSITHTFIQDNIYGLSLNVFNLSEAADNPFNFCVRLIIISISYLFPVVLSGFFVHFSWRGYNFPTRVPQVSVSGSRQTRPLFYPVRQLYHVCRVDAEEDVQDFRPIRPGLDPPEIVVFLLCPERAFHRSRPRSGKFLSDKVFLLILLSASKLKKPQHLLGLCLVFVQYKIVHD